MGRYVQPIISDSLIVCPLGTIRGMRPAGEFHTVPEKPVLDGLEQAWSQVWDAEGVYRFPDPSGLTREQVYSIDTIPKYLEFLRTHAPEVRALLQDMLIGVTHFFRDRESFAALEAHIPQLFAGKTAEDQLHRFTSSDSS